MKTKQEVIQEAYGEHYDKFKDSIDENGWTEDAIYNFLVCEWHPAKWAKVRPKSLSGLENNNGWTRIESEDDLPKRENNLWLRANDGSTILGRWCIFEKMFKTDHGNNFDSDGIVFTHYQHISEPKPPIY